MSAQWTVVVSLLCAILGAALGYLNFTRQGRKDAADTARSETTVMVEIGYIKASLDDVKRLVERQQEYQSLVMERLVAVEASAKQAHKRVDRLEGRNEG
jgi:hypothetical protein